MRRWMLSVLLFSAAFSPALADEDDAEKKAIAQIRESGALVLQDGEGTVAQAWLLQGFRFVTRWLFTATCSMWRRSALSTSRRNPLTTTASPTVGTWPSRSSTSPATVS